MDELETYVVDEQAEPGDNHEILFITFPFLAPSCGSPEQIANKVEDQNTGAFSRKSKGKYLFVAHVHALLPSLTRTEKEGCIFTVRKRILKSEIEN